MQTKPLRTLAGLIDFDSAAQWGSFKLAAKVLHKTPAAVSQQIRQLEESMGFPLFVRHARHITLTEKGTALASEVRFLLGRLRAHVNALQRNDEGPILRVSATHSFAIKWLVPRMHRLTALHPELDIRLDSNDQLVDLNADSTDVALRFGPVASDDPDLLFKERPVIVYSPNLLAPGQEALCLEDLANFPLLYEGGTEMWIALLKENKVLNADYEFSRGYSHFGVLVQAAVAGHGIALVPYAIACEDLLKASLKMLACRGMPSASGYRLLTNPAKTCLLKISQFSDWIRSEMAEMERASPTI